MGVNVNTLRKMRKSHVEQLIPSTYLGIQIDFYDSLINWQHSQGIYLENTCPHHQTIDNLPNIQAEHIEVQSQSIPIVSKFTKLFFFGFILKLI